jgi:hypothetical protein
MHRAHTYLAVDRNMRESGIVLMTHQQCGNEWHTRVHQHLHKYGHMLYDLTLFTLSLPMTLHLCSTRSNFI